MSEVLNEILNVQGLTVEYPGFTLGPCSFSMKRGEILAAAGESGSGKTTLARALSRLLEEEAAVAGEVVIAGSSLYEKKEEEVHGSDGTVFHRLSEFGRMAESLHEAESSLGKR
ncbi:ATP-binding cassette domain-containing protein [Hungatella sp.]|uniref:ATP-binding cassette domain-containing protein n=1 Tax=Hungatella sp. TaxID=2613924 RepID=UPI003995652C